MRQLLKLIALAGFVLALGTVGCGEGKDYCVDPGNYDCTYTIMQTNCMAGTTWIITADWSSSWCGSYNDVYTGQDGGCALNCSGVFTATSDTTANGMFSCNLLCATSNCSVSATATCTYR